MSDYLADSLANLLEPDVLLPSQFNVPDDAGIGGGERKLMAALLSDGIEAYIAQVTSPKASKRAKKHDACEWVDTKDPSYVFSFDIVCESLGIDPDYLRLGLYRYVQATRERRLVGETNGERAWKKIRRPRK